MGQREMSSSTEEEGKEPVVWLQRNKNLVFYQKI